MPVNRIVEDLKGLGITSPDFVMAHVSMRKVGGRAEDLVEALLTALHPYGTLLSYVDFEESDDIPFFDPSHSPACRDYGIFPEIVRRHPNSIRSLNPGASVCAIGKQAKWLCADHPNEYGYGINSPFHKLVEKDGKVLLLGSDWD